MSVLFRLALGLAGAASRSDEAANVSAVSIIPPTLQAGDLDEMRLQLGRAGGELLTSWPGASVMILGPTRARMDLDITSNAVAGWPGPVVAVSSTGSLYDKTRASRSSVGEVALINPTLGVEGSASWPFLDRARSWPAAQELARTMASTQRGVGLQEGDFWFNAAGKLLAPHLFAAAANLYTMADVVRWIETQDEYEVRSLLQATGVEEAIVSAEASWQREDRARSSIYTTAEQVLEPFRNFPAIERGHNSVRADFLLSKDRNTLYLVDNHFKSSKQSLFAVLVQDLCDTVWAWQNEIEVPVLVVLEDAANTAPLAELTKLAGAGDAHGLLVMSSWQDLSELKRFYGDSTNAVIDNHSIKVLLPGISDGATRAYMESIVPSSQREAFLDEWTMAAEDEAIVICSGGYSPVKISLGRLSESSKIVLR